MSLNRLHLVCTYILLCLGTTALWIGESDFIPPYPILVVLCAIAAFFFTDTLKLMEMPHVVSNALGVVILGTIVFEFANGSTTNINALAHFLVYLQVVKCFRRKNNSDFWQLYAISLLQLVIGCVLSREMNFGMILIVYQVLGIFTLALFLLKQHDDLDSIASSQQGVPTAARFNGVVSSRLVARLAWLCLSSVPLAIIGFWLIPRPNLRGAYEYRRTETAGRTLQTGFSSTVRLDELSTILESEDVVFSIWPRDNQGRPVTLPDELLWRGIAFVTYDRRQWVAAPDIAVRATSYWNKTMQVRPGQLDLTIEQVVRTGDIAFCPKPVFWAELLEEEGNIQYVRMEGRLVLINYPKSESSATRAFSYRLITDLSRAAFRDPEEVAPSLEYRDMTLEVPSHLTRLRDLAAQLTRGIPENDIDAKIDAIMTYLNSTGEIGYSLDIRPVDTSIDPVEDFLFNRKAGHCEYFASALALLLRSVGISTRVLNGFKGVDYNDAGNYYQVRQLHAHSWVEAYIPQGGYWRTLDPTPGEARDTIVARQRSAFRTFADLYDAGGRLWYGWIIGYTGAQQQEIADRILGWLQEAWTTRGGSILLALMGLAQDMATAAFWISPAGVLTLAVFLFVGFVARRVGPPLVRWLLARLRGESMVLSSDPTYARWQTMLRRHGWIRKAAQTPREFALEIQTVLANKPECHRWRQLPIDIIDYHYRRRFGDLPASPERVEQLRIAIDGLAKDLPSAVNGRNGHATA